MKRKKKETESQVKELYKVASSPLSTLTSMKPPEICFICDIQCHLFNKLFHCHCHCHWLVLGYIYERYDFCLLVTSTSSS